MSGPDTPEDPRAYVRAVIGAYVRLPATPARARREDRRVAYELHARGVPLTVVEAGLLLGAVRKARPLTEATPLTTTLLFDKELKKNGSIAKIEVAQEKSQPARP